MGEAWVIVVVLLGAMMAGCLASETGTGDETGDGANGGQATAPGTPSLPDGSPAPTSVTLSGCSEQAGAFPVPASDFEEGMPEGFEPVPFAGDPTGQTVTLVVISFTCTLADGDPVSELWGFLQVEPPEELSAGEDVFHMAILGAITTGEDLADVYHAWGMGDSDSVFAGEVTLETLQETPVARGGHALASADGFTLHLYTTVEGSEAPEEAGMARIFGVSGGEVIGAGDLHWTDSEGGLSQGQGVLAFEEDVPLPQPQGPGVAWHYWGESYDIEYTYVALA